MVVNSDNEWISYKQHTSLLTVAVGVKDDKYTFTAPGVGILQLDPKEVEERRQEITVS